MKSFAALFIGTLFGGIAANPSVTPKLVSVPQTCAYWPTGRFMIVIDAAEDPAVNGLPAQPYDIIFPSKVLPLLAMDLRASRRIAKSIYACDAGQAVVASSTFKKLGICQDRENGHILIDAPAEKVLVPELYKHVVEGKEVDGLYIGAKNQTTWGFRYTPSSCYRNGTVSTKDYYESKLLGLPESKYDTAGYEVEFQGFLKVVAW